MPAFVNSRVGSSPGTTGDEATMVWPFDSKNFRKVERISAAFIPALSGGHAVVSPGRAAGARRGRAEPSIIGGGVATPAGDGNRHNVTVPGAITSCRGT